MAGRVKYRTVTARARNKREMAAVSPREGEGAMDTVGKLLCGFSASAGGALLVPFFLRGVRGGLCVYKVGETQKMWPW